MSEGGRIENGMALGVEIDSFVICGVGNATERKKRWNHADIHYHVQLRRKRESQRPKLRAERLTENDWG